MASRTNFCHALDFGEALRGQVGDVFSASKAEHLVVKELLGLLFAFQFVEEHGLHSRCRRQASLTILAQLLELLGAVLRSHAGRTVLALVGKALTGGVAQPDGVWESE